MYELSRPDCRSGKVIKTVIEETFQRHNWVLYGVLTTLYANLFSNTFYLQYVDWHFGCRKLVTNYDGCSVPPNTEHSIKYPIGRRIYL